MLGRHTVTITMYVASFDRSRLPFPKITTAHIPRCLSSPNLRNLVKLSQAQRPIHYLSHQQPLKISGAVMRAKLSSSKGDFLRLGTSHAADTLRTNAGELVVGTQGYYPRSSSRQQLTSPLHVSDVCRKPRSPTARVQLYFSLLPRSRRWFQRRLRRMTIRPTWKPYAGLSAAGAGALWVEVVVRDGGGTPIRLTSWAKSSVTSSIKRAGAWGEDWLSGDSVLRGDGLAAATFAQFFLLSLLPLETFHTFLGSC